MVQHLSNAELCAIYSGPPRTFERRRNWHVSSWSNVGLRAGARCQPIAEWCNAVSRLLIPSEARVRTARDVCLRRTEVKSSGALQIICEDRRRRFVQPLDSSVVRQLTGVSDSTWIVDRVRLRKSNHRRRIIESGTEQWCLPHRRTVIPRCSKRCWLVLSNSNGSSRMLARDTMLCFCLCAFVCLSAG